MKKEERKGLDYTGNGGMKSCNVIKCFADL